jgi:hypothetical protein
MLTLEDTEPEMAEKKVCFLANTLEDGRKIKKFKLLLQNFREETK